MAGGIGSRFWPLSRTSYPKQFLDILGTGQTLLQSTYDRFSSFIEHKNIFIVTSDDYVDIVAQQLPLLPEENIIGEPERKNTAPCIAYISMKLQLINPNANLIIAPSDHLILDPENFRTTCLQALDYTEKNNSLVTLGIRPTHPHTGYGYIKSSSETKNEYISKVDRFTEKPCLEKAIEFLSDDSYFWNSGIFIWKSEDIIEAFQLYNPEMYNLFHSELNSKDIKDENEVIKSIYNKCESVSIDYAIMEHAKNVFVIPAQFKWSDLGAWNSAWENFEKDENENAMIGKNIVLADSNGCIVHSNDDKLILVGGLEDMIVVNTKDAILICKRENEQHIKDYLQKLSEVKGNQFL